MINWSRLRPLATSFDNKLGLLLAFVVGGSTGVAAWLFIRLIELSQYWPAVPGQTPFWFGTVNRFLIVAVPATGGLLCGLILQYFSPSAKGTGTADLMYSLRRQGGLVDGKQAFFKTLASIFTVCSGGAAGPEAPGVYIGAGIGSQVGRWRPSDRMNLMVAGAAAGFAAVFNAPIAGVFFAIEVMLKEFASQALTLIILSTVTASVTTRLLLGNRVFVQVPPTYTLNHIWELFYYAILAVLAAIVSKLFVQFYFWIDHLFEEWKQVPLALKPMLGGLLLGVMALFIPSVLGNGHSEIPNLIVSELSSPWLWSAMLLLLLGKMIACPLSLGSGGSGGIFIPFLLMGALLGGLVGRVVHVVSPTAAPAGAYMLVGMGAMFSGITFAPFTGILLLFELTQDYNLVLPLMFTVGLTMLVARAIDPESIDSRKLLKRGVRVHETVELRALEKYRVQDLMTRKVTTIPQTMTLGKITEFIAKHPHTGYPVVDEADHVVGLITYAELHQTFNVGELPPTGILARDIMREQVPKVHAEDALTEAVRRMQTDGFDRVLVVGPDQKMVGIITKGDILNIYRKLLS
jgi:chloride channel protein, CIC family